MVTGNEVSARRVVGLPPEGFCARKFEASLENIFECDRLVLDSPSCYAALGVKVTS